MKDCGYFDTAGNDNHSSFLTPTAVGGDAHFPLKYVLKMTYPLRKTPTSTDFRL